jgi:CubicO group peptidase (beta-lactamase class C family)
VGVFKHGRAIYQRGFGSKRLGVHDPITPRSVFNLGSISKQFTAFCLLLLQDRGRLSLDDSVCKHLPEMQARFSDVKLHHLMHHSSGLRSAVDMLWPEMEKGIYKPDALSTIRMQNRQKERNFEPGAEFCYNNDGYILLAEIIQRSNGQSLADFASENIFRPLGMRRTRFRESQRAYVPDRVLGYRRAKSGWQAALKSCFVTGAGDLWSCIEDLALWERNFFEHRVGSERVHRQMLQPGKLEHRLAGDWDYGGGLQLGRALGRKATRHTGLDSGACANYLRLPEQGLAVVLLYNRETMSVFQGHKVLEKVLSPSKALLKDPVKRALPKRFRAFNGYYECEEGRGFWRLQARSHGFHLDAGAFDKEFLFNGKEELHAADPSGWVLHFATASDGIRTLKAYYAGRLRQSLRFVGRGSAKFAGMDELVGSYRSFEVSASTQLKKVKGKLYYHDPIGEPGNKELLRSLGSDRLAWLSGGYYCIERNKAGKVIALMGVSPAGRNKRLRVFKVA